MAIDLKALDPTGYTPHAFHRGTERAWTETNCYADLWVEVLHALRLEPAACLGMTLGIDFEGDQWTFFKPSHESLRALYGLQVEELTIWRDLRTHAAMQTARGRIVLAEVDAMYLPDTAATDYKQNHSKTTVGITRIDGETVDYFHNGGFWRVSGADVAGLFSAKELPLFCEMVKLDHVELRPDAQLRPLAVVMLRETLHYRPRVNPFVAFGEHLKNDGVTAKGLADWHKYAFASVRQCGAAFELAGSHLRWLGEGFATVAPACEAISATCKLLILKGARAANSGKPLDASEAVASMRANWDTIMAELDKLLR